MRSLSESHEIWWSTVSFCGSKVWLSFVNFLDYWKIVVSSTLNMWNLCFISLFCAFSSILQSSFPLEIISFFHHSVCTAKQNLCLTNVSAIHFQNCPLGKFKWNFKVSLRMQTINSLISCRHLYIGMTKKGSG